MRPGWTELGQRLPRKLRIIHRSQVASTEAKVSLPQVIHTFQVVWEIAYYYESGHPLERSADIHAIQSGITRAESLCIQYQADRVVQYLSPPCSLRSRRSTPRRVVAPACGPKIRTLCCRSYQLLFISAMRILLVLRSQTNRCTMHGAVQCTHHTKNGTKTLGVLFLLLCSTRHRHAPLIRYSCPGVTDQPGRRWMSVQEAETPRAASRTGFAHRDHV